jgi:hypothetical protein
MGPSYDARQFPSKINIRGVSPRPLISLRNPGAMKKPPMPEASVRSICALSTTWLAYFDDFIRRRWLAWVAYFHSPLRLAQRSFLSISVRTSAAPHMLPFPQHAVPWPHAVDAQSLRCDVRPGRDISDSYPKPLSNIPYPYPCPLSSDRCNL